MVGFCRTITVAAAVALAGPAIAASSDADVQVNGIASVHVASMEAAARLSPRDGGALSDLANAYLSIGRTEAALATYRRVLKADNVMLETRNGDWIWSHQVARGMLSQSPNYTSL